MTDPTPQELARQQNQTNAALDRLTVALDRMSTRLDNLPETMERTYVRKDVAKATGDRIDDTLRSLTDTLREHAKQTQDQFDRLSAAVRWVVAAVLIPVVLAIFALLNQHGGIG